MFAVKATALNSKKRFHVQKLAITFIHELYLKGSVWLHLYHPMLVNKSLPEKAACQF